MLRPGTDKGIATPIPLGLAALATTSFLLGVGVIFQSSHASAPYLVQALVFGGLLELLAGMWAFSYGDAFAATVFSFLGAFFGWWGLAQMPFMGAAMTAPAAADSVAMIFIVSGVVTFYLWIASFYEFAAFNLALLFLWPALVLRGIATFVAASPLLVVGGIAALICGLIAAYASFATIFNAASLKEALPLGEPRNTRQRAERDEMERIQRIHPTANHQAGAHA